MRYQIEMDIDLPRERVLELFLDPESLAKWQPGFLRLEHISGEEPRGVGTKSRHVQKMGNRELETIETITVNDYPNRFSATYEAGNVCNLIDNRFVEAGDFKTHWILQSEFQCSGFMRLVALVAPGMFKKRTREFMQHFKNFAETPAA